MKDLFTILLTTSLLFSTACSHNSKDQKNHDSHTKKSIEVLGLQGRTMGTSYSIKWELPKQSLFTKSELQQAIEQRLLEVNKAMSTYDKTSEITQINQKNTGQYTISEDFYKTLVIAHEVSEQSEGAFDATLSPLINLWGFGHKGTVEKQPTLEQITIAKKNIGYTNISLLGNNTIHKSTDVTLNLSAVAKGYGVDAIAKTLEKFKIDNYFVEIGGEVITKGQKDGTGWKVGIEKPNASKRAIQQVLNVSNTALATSGDYRNYFEQNGTRFSHTIDPHTGYPITHKLASVSVLHTSCAKADAYATALLVMGEKKGIVFAKQHNINALFIVKYNTAFKEITTGNFAERTLTNTH